MTAALLLTSANGGKELVDGRHVQGYRDGQLLIATGAIDAYVAWGPTALVPTTRSIAGND